MSDEPLPAGDNGRGGNGRFLPGNRAGKGNPNNRKAQHFRNLILSATSDDDMLAIWQQVLDAAKKGEPWAVAIVLDRTCGRPQEHVVLDQITELERQLGIEPGDTL